MHVMEIIFISGLSIIFIISIFMIVRGLIIAATCIHEKIEECHTKTCAKCDKEFYKELK
jgi:hypothetical protein